MTRTSSLSTRTSRAVNHPSSTRPRNQPVISRVVSCLHDYIITIMHQRRFGRPPSAWQAGRHARCRPPTRRSGPARLGGRAHQGGRAPDADPVPGRRPRHRVQGRRHAGHRGRQGRRGLHPGRAGRRPSRRRHPRRGGGHHRRDEWTTLGASTPSTAPRRSCGACRSTPTSLALEDEHGWAVVGDQPAGHRRVRLRRPGPGLLPGRPPGRPAPGPGRPPVRDPVPDGVGLHPLGRGRPARRQAGRLGAADLGRRLRLRPGRHRPGRCHGRPRGQPLGRRPHAAGHGRGRRPVHHRRRRRTVDRRSRRRAAAWPPTATATTTCSPSSNPEVQVQALEKRSRLSRSRRTPQPARRGR